MTEAPTPSPGRFERHPRLTLTVTVVGALLVLAGLDALAAEVYFARTGHTWADRAAVRAWERQQRYRIEGLPYHHGLRPGVDLDDAVWAHRVYPLATNDLGFVDAAPRAVTRMPTGRRLLFVGDSFTEGVGVAYPETFAGRVAAALAPHGIEVLNTAVASYAPLIHWRKLKHLIETVGLGFDEVIVLLDYSDVTDEWYRYTLDAASPDSFVVRRPQPERRFAGTARLRRHSIALHAAAQAVRRRVQPGAGVYANRLTAWAREAGAFEDVGAPGLALMETSMDRLHALLRTHGVGLTVAVYPWPDQIADGDTASVHRTHWRGWAARRGVPLLDLFPAFTPPPDTPARAFVEEHFIRGDVHWNEAGHRRVARAVLAFLYASPDPPRAHE